MGGTGGGQCDNEQVSLSVNDMTDTNVIVSVLLGG